MAKQTVPRGKQSKKQQRAEAARRRATWGFSPVSRVKQSGKVYRRARKLPEEP